MFNVGTCSWSYRMFMLGVMYCIILGNYCTLFPHLSKENIAMQSAKDDCEDQIPSIRNIKFSLYYRQNVLKLVFLIGNLLKLNFHKFIDRRSLILRCTTWTHNSHIPPDEKCNFIAPASLAFACSICLFERQFSTINT